jgi:HEAT repeat protein
MRFISVVSVILLSLTSIIAQRADKSGSGTLVEDFRRSRIFYEQLEIGKKIVAIKDPSVLEKLTDLLRSEDRHIRGNAAFIFAGLGDVRGLKIINEIIQDRSYRVEGQGGRGGAPSNGKYQYRVERQIAADRYYAVHLLAELHDPKAIPILTPLVKDTTINDKVVWVLGQIPDKSAIPPLLEALQSKDPDVRLGAIQSLEQLRATEALPQLRALLNDNERSNYNTPSVAETARRAISTLEKKP